MNEVLDLVREITGRDVKFFSSPLVLLDALGFIGELITIMTRIRLPLARASMKMFTQHARVGGPGIVNQNAIRDQFGYPKFTLKESLSDSLSWLYENGHLNAKQSGKLANI